MSNITNVFAFLLIFGVAAPVGALLVVADLDTAGKVHALNVAKAERLARWKAGEF